MISLATIGHDRDLVERTFAGYLSRRHIGAVDIFRHKLGFCASGHYAGRIIIPSFDKNGVLSTFTGRTIYDGVKPKYDGPEIDKTTVVFNELMVDWDRDVILVEGQMDAIVGGENVIPLCGKTLPVRSILFRRLITAGKTVYVALDPDAVKESIEICVSLAAHDVRAMFVPMFGTDPADAGRRQFRERLLAAFEVTDKIDGIKAKLRMMQ